MPFLHVELPQGTPGGLDGHRQRGGLLEGQPGGHGQQIPGVDRHVGGRGTGDDLAEDGLPHTPAPVSGTGPGSAPSTGPGGGPSTGPSSGPGTGPGPGPKTGAHARTRTDTSASASANGVDRSGELDTDARGPGRQLATVHEPVAEFPVDAVDPGGPYRDPHLPGSGIGNGNVVKGEHLGAAVPGVADGLGHGFLPLSACAPIDGMEGRARDHGGVGSARIGW